MRLTKKPWRDKKAASTRLNIWENRTDSSHLIQIKKSDGKDLDKMVDLSEDQGRLHHHCEQLTETKDQHQCDEILMEKMISGYFGRQHLWRPEGRLPVQVWAILRPQINLDDLKAGNDNLFIGLDKSRRRPEKHKQKGYRKKCSTVFITKVLRGC